VAAVIEACFHGNVIQVIFGVEKKFLRFVKAYVADVLFAGTAVLFAE